MLNLALPLLVFSILIGDVVATLTSLTMSNGIKAGGGTQPLMKNKGSTAAGMGVSTVAMGGASSSFRGHSLMADNSKVSFGAASFKSSDSQHSASRFASNALPKRNQEGVYDDAVLRTMDSLLEKLSLATDKMYIKYLNHKIRAYEKSQQPKEPNYNHLTFKNNVKFLTAITVGAISETFLNAKNVLDIANKGAHFIYKQATTPKFDEELNAGLKKHFEEKLKGKEKLSVSDAQDIVLQTMGIVETIKNKDVELNGDGDIVEFGYDILGNRVSDGLRFVSKKYNHKLTKSDLYQIGTFLTQVLWELTFDENEAKGDQEAIKTLSLAMMEGQKLSKEAVVKYFLGLCFIEIEMGGGKKVKTQFGYHFLEKTEIKKCA